MSADRTPKPPTPLHPIGRPQRSPRRFLAMATAWLLCLGLLTAWGSTAAWAWGRLGHQIAGKIAEDRLTPNARKAVQELLDPGQTLADVSTWADEVRRDRPESATWHYVNVPISAANYDRKYEDPKGGVVSKILEFQKAIADPSAPRQKRQEALKYLVHFVQDMHQPVHVGHRADRGGNDLQVQFFDKGSNLHRVWDSDLLEHANLARSQYTQALEKQITPDRAAEWSRGSVEDWANESLQFARKAYTQPGTTGELRKGAKLGQPYYEANLPLAEQRIEQAGVRLASLLNAAFP